MSSVIDSDLVSRMVTVDDIKSWYIHGTAQFIC